MIYFSLQHLYDLIINRSGFWLGPHVPPCAFPEQRGHKLPEMKPATFRTLNNGEQLHNDGVLFSSTVGERRPSAQTDAARPSEERVCDANGREVSALVGRRPHSQTSPFSKHYLHFLLRHEREEKVKYIPVVKEVTCRKFHIS